MKNVATKIFPLVLLLPLFLTLSACNSVNKAGPTPKYPLLVGVTLKPHSVPAIAVAGTLQVNASAQYQVSASEFTEKDVTGSVAWDTSSTAVATVTKGVGHRHRNWFGHHLSRLLRASRAARRSSSDSPTT